MKFVFLRAVQPQNRLRFRRFNKSIPGLPKSRLGGRHCSISMLMLLTFLGIFSTQPDLTIADEPAVNGEMSVDTIHQHLHAGEFAAARRASQALPQAERDRARALIAQKLSSAGQTTAAFEDLQAINNPTLANSTIAAMLNRTSSGNPLGYSSYSPNDGEGLSNNDGGLNPLQGNPGGGSMADFSQLMNLIQTVIAPDQWEALGGPSTLFPYPAGIYVDPSGLVRDVAVLPSDRVGGIDNLAGQLRVPTDAQSNEDWTAPASLRIVSLKRLRETYLRHATLGQHIPLALQNLAGLSEIRYVIVDTDDILLAGPVGGINPGANPWPQDLSNQKTALGLDLLVASAHSVLHQQAYGCSIDPTPEGVQAAAKVSQEISSRSLSPALAAEALAKAMGKQDILLFDVPADQPLAWLLVDADRHMKQLALGQHPMPAGVANYLDIIEQATKDPAIQAVPGGQFLRMWFSTNPKQVQKASSSMTFELSGLPIKLITAKEFADGQGGRVQAGDDPLGQQFAAGFNRHFEAIAAKYPIYDRLRGAFEMTAALQLVKSQIGADAFARLVGELANPDLVLDQTVAVPTRCDSLAVRHTIRTPNKRHEVFVVSGGVKVDPAVSLVSEFSTYPVLDELAIGSEQAPLSNTRWWWDR